MVRKCIIERERKRYKLFLKYFHKFKNLKNVIKTNDINSSNYYQALIKFSKIPRNANSVRKRNRCFITGRGRGFFRFFGLSRFCIRNLSFNGYIPGILKSSW